MNDLPSEGRMADFFTVNWREVQRLMDERCQPVVDRIKRERLEREAQETEGP